MTELVKKIELDGEDFFYLEVESLPKYWQLKIKGEIHWSNKTPRCPYCGGEFEDLKNPIEHKHCKGMCGRNYAE